MESLSAFMIPWQQILIALIFEKVLAGSFSQKKLLGLQVDQRSNLADKLRVRSIRFVP